VAGPPFPLGPLISSRYTDELPVMYVLHSLRHGFASLLIAKGLNVVFVSRQLGHANPTVTLSTYAHLFERADHAEAAREALEASYAATVGPSC
jgi:integrase